MPNKVSAFYYDWYGNPERSGRWMHWNECHYTTRDPSRVDERGYRDLGAAHNPMLGPYDSEDPDVIEAHIGMAEASFEAEVRDAQTGEVLLVGIRSSTGDKYKVAKSVTKWGQVEAIFDRWAGNIRERLEKLSGR